MNRGTRASPFVGPALLAGMLFAACGPTPPPQAGPLVPSPSIDLSAAGSPPPDTPAPPAPEPSPLSVASLAPLRTPAPPPPGSSVSLPANLRGVEWTRLPTSQPVVALTFDGGAGAEGMPSILDTLAREHVPGTFFITGRWAATYPDLAHRIVATAGNQVGDHTMDHPDLTRLSDAEVQAEVSDGRRWIHDVTGHETRPLFRFPYGASDTRVLADVNALGFGSIRWTIDTLGWEGTSRGQSTDSVYARAVGSAQPGEIVLMHVGAAPDGSTLDADALPRVIAELRRRGYGFVRVGAYAHT